MKLFSKKKLSSNKIKLDLTGNPKIDSNNFQELHLSNYFGIYADKAYDMHKEGFCTINIKDKNFINVVSNLKLKLEDKKDILFKENNRLQDGWEDKNFFEISEIACHKEILDLLRILFGREPFPFQTLNFFKGSSQAIHSDIVHFNSVPSGFMCGVWVALEDIDPNSGPLSYYPQSHRLPILKSSTLNLKNSDISKHPHPQTLFESKWSELICENNLNEQKFIAKKGDILLWHSNLLHGGSKIQSKDLTRFSQVTHYFFKKCLYKRPFHETTNISHENLWFKPKNILRLSK